MTRYLFLLCLLLCSFLSLPAQNVGINESGNQPHTSAMLDVSSNSKGVLIPRLTTFQRNNIQSPAIGLLVFDSTKEAFYLYSSTGWQVIRAGNIDAIQDDDDDTSVTVEQTPDEDIVKMLVRDTLVFEAEGKRIIVHSPGLSLFVGNESGKSDNGTMNQNMFIGEEAGKANVNGEKNIYLGNYSGKDHSNGDNNTFIGWGSGASGSGNNNTMLGKETGSQSNGNGNVFIGHKTGVNVNVNNELRIHNGPVSTPLIHGRFDSLDLTINGTLKIGNEYALPDTLGQVGQILKVNASNQLVWMTDAYQDNDNDPTNEKQILTKSGNTITLSNGGGSVIDAVNDADFSTTNELQNLTISGNQLSISSGNTITLPSVNGSFIEDEETEFWVYQNGTDKSAYLTFSASQYFNLAPYYFKERYFQIKHPNNSLIIGDNSIGGVQNTADVIAIGNNNNFINGQRSIHIGNATAGSDQLGIGKNTIIGHYANGYFSNVGYETVAIGDSACYNGARQSVFIGNQAGLGTENSTKNYNVGIGYRAGASLQSQSNTLVGFEAGENITTGSSNVAVGYSALNGVSASVTGSYNVAMGRFALANVTTGERNIALGYSSLNDLSTASGNISIGTFAQRQNETGIGNIAIGDSSLRDNVFGNHNIAFGQSAGLKIRTNRNIAIGTRALYNFIGNNNQFSNNIAIGFQAMENTIEGALGLGFNNIALGNNALQNNTTGEQNIAIGHFASQNNVGTNCTVIGFQAGATALDQDDNTLIGAWAGNSLDFYSPTSSNNTMVGAHVGRSLSGGLNNTLMGEDCVRNATNGPDNNVVLGTNALYTSTALGNDNAVVGYSAGYNSNNMSASVIMGARGAHDMSSITNSVVIGKDAAFGPGTLSNSIVIGYDAVSGGSNSARIGNSAVTSIGGFANWTNVSDRRIKTNVVENVPGLSFINLLRPVTYTMDQKTILEMQGLPADESLPISDVTHTGFIAQEVEAAAESLNYDFSGVDRPAETNALYGLRYAEFTVPLVKAVQELSEQNSRLEERIKVLEEMVKNLAEMKK